MSGAKKCILVTGGGGFIGSHCILELLREDFDVVVVDNFDNCVKGNLVVIFVSLATFSNLPKLLTVTDTELQNNGLEGCRHAMLYSTPTPDNPHSDDKGWKRASLD